MNNLLSLLLVVVFTFAVPISVTAQTQEAPEDTVGVNVIDYSVLHEKPLAIGDSVWVNIGDTECAYPWDSYYPNASDECFEEYVKAWVVTDLKMYGTYLYRVAFKIGDDGEAFYRNAPFDLLYEVVGLDEKWSSYSNRILLLNW